MERLRGREIDDDEGRRLVRIVRRDSGPVVTWRRAQMVLLPAQGMDVVLLREEGVTLNAPLESLHRPGLRGQEGPHRAPVRDRRP